MLSGGFGLEKRLFYLLFFSVYTVASLHALDLYDAQKDVSVDTDAAEQTQIQKKKQIEETFSKPQASRIKHLITKNTKGAGYTIITTDPDGGRTKGELFVFSGAALLAGIIDCTERFDVQDRDQKNKRKNVVMGVISVLQVATSLVGVCMLIQKPHYSKKTKRTIPKDNLFAALQYFKGNGEKVFFSSEVYEELLHQQTIH